MSISTSVQRTLQRGLWRLQSVFASVNEEPIIVVGNQKSGTSAIAHLLADYGGLTKTIDIPPLWGYRGLDVMRERRVFGEVVHRYARFFTADLVKEPMMTFFLDQVIDRFPDASYVFIVRDPRDNIRSLLNRRNLPGNVERLRAADKVQLASERCTLDADAWQIEAKTYIELLAKRWNLAIENLCTLQHSSSYGMHVRYEDFVSDKYAFIARLAERLEVEEQQDITDRLDAQYQPKGNRDVSWEDFFGRENAIKIEDECKGNMEKIGYEMCFI